jgi:hypothetical protein
MGIFYGCKEEKLLKENDEEREKFWVGRARPIA